MWCAYFAPETFHDQTAATFSASLRGRDKARRLQADQDLASAWHIAAFSVAAQNGKLKPLKEYLDPAAATKKPQTLDDMLNTLLALQASGAPMDIKQIN
jgi:hypothetical protein